MERRREDAGDGGLRAGKVTERRRPNVDFLLGEVFALRPILPGRMRIFLSPMAPPTLVPPPADLWSLASGVLANSTRIREPMTNFPSMAFIARRVSLSNANSTNAKPGGLRATQTSLILPNFPNSLSRSSLVTFSRISPTYSLGGSLGALPLCKKRKKY